MIMKPDTLTVEETLQRLRFCSDASLIASLVLSVTTTSCMPAMQSPAVSHSICSSVMELKSTYLCWKLHISKTFSNKKNSACSSNETILKIQLTSLRRLIIIQILSEFSQVNDMILSFYHVMSYYSP